MKISEAINSLNLLKDNHGDVDILLNMKDISDNYDEATHEPFGFNVMDDLQYRDMDTDELGPKRKAVEIIWDN